jgi:hypothetical protein
MEHPEFGGDSILPRCSRLGDRCLPRYRRLTEPRVIISPLFVYRTSVQLRCPDVRSIPAGLSPTAHPLGAGISSSGTPGLRRGFPGLVKGDAQRHRLQCRVVKPGRRVSTGTGLVWVTGLAAGTRVSWCAGAASTLAYSHDPWLYAVSCSMWPFLRTGNGLLPGCFRCPDREWPGAPGRLAVGSAGCPQGRETVPAGVARKRVWLPLLPLRWPRR